MSNKKSDAQHIFNKWAAELRHKDLKWASVRNNFEELFYELWKHEIAFDEAHEMIKQATIKHFPSLAIAKRTYENVKKGEHFSGDSFQEWFIGWKKGIEDQALEAFYSMYTPPSLEDKNKETDNRIGGMDPVEYRKQRRYAESFPVILTEELEKQTENGITNTEDFFKGLEKILEKSIKNES